jgi:uncharacterized protein YrrD
MAEHEVNVGARVKSHDGKKLGVVKELIVDPKENRIDGFILGQGIRKGDKIVRRGLVAETSAKGVVLSIDAAEADNLPAVIHEQLVRGSEALTYGAGYGGAGYGTVGVGGSSDQVFLRGPSGGQFPHTGTESFFAQAPIGNVVTENISNIPTDRVAISEGTDVYGSDGEKIGHVDEVFVDDQRQIAGILVRAGRVFHHDVHIPSSLIAGLTHDRIRLNVTAEEAERQSRRDE